MLGAMRVWILGASLWLLASSALANDSKGRPVLVVIQSGLGGTNGDALRAELAERFKLEVLALRSSEISETRPRALLTLSVDERSTLNAIYWDESGTMDVFSAPAPKDAAALQAAAATLAIAIVQRHIAAIRAPRGLPHAEADELTAYGPTHARAFYAAIARFGSVGRLGIDLKIEDF
jgi:hypothetical protein